MKQRWYVLYPSLLAVLLYGITLRNGFVFDDRVVLVTDQRMGHLGAFFHVSWGELVMRYWSLLIDSVIWGLNPLGFHLTNTLLHAAVGLFLFLYLRKLLVLFNNKRAALAALVGALLLVAHPMNTEAVAAISHRKEMLAGLFLLWALYRSLGSGRTLYRSLEVGLLLGLALLSKAPAIMYFPLALFTEFLQKRRRVRFYIAPVLVAAGYIASRFGGLSQAVTDSRYFNAFNPQMIDSSAVGRFATSLKTLIMYWWLGVWPWQPTMERFIRPATFGQLEPWIVLALCVMGLFFSWRERKDHPLLSLGLFWLIITPLPTINVIPLNFLFSERYMYVPILGFALVAAWAVGRDSRIWVPGILLVLALGVFSPLVVRRNLEWKDSSTLLAATVRDNPLSPRLNRFYAMDLNKQGRHEEALAAARMAVRGMPKSPVNWYVYAQSLSVNHRLKEATEAYGHAIRIADHPRPMWISNYGVALVMGGRVKEAQEQFALALQMSPHDSRIRLHYVQGLMMTPKTRGQAIDYVVRTLREDPEDQSLWALLAEARLGQGDVYACVEAARQGRKHGSDPLLSSYLKGLEAEAQGRSGDARAQYQTILGDPELDPQLGSRVSRALKRVPR